MDPFATLGIERRFDVDLRAVERTHRELSRALHPDRYVSGTGEKREALSRAVEVNEALRIIKDPVRRAEALFSLADVAVGETREPKPSSALLMDIMEQREALEEAKDARQLERVNELARAIEARALAVEGEMTAAFSAAAGDKDKLVPLLPKLGELRFYRRFLEEVSAIEDLLGEEG